MIRVVDAMPAVAELLTQSVVFTSPRPVMSLNDIYDLLPEIAAVSDSSRIVAARMESSGFIEVTAPWYTLSQGVMVMRSGTFMTKGEGNDAKLWSVICCQPSKLDINGLIGPLFKQALSRINELVAARVKNDASGLFTPATANGIDEWVSNILIQTFAGNPL